MGASLVHWRRSGTDTTTTQYTRRSYLVRLQRETQLHRTNNANALAPWSDLAPSAFVADVPGVYDLTLVLDDGCERFTSALKVDARCPAAPVSSTGALTSRTAILKGSGTTPRVLEKLSVA